MSTTVQREEEKQEVWRGEAATECGMSYVTAF